MEYTVTWTIDVEAENVREAAQKALDTQRSYMSTATVFDVAPKDTQYPEEVTKRVDLSISVYDEAREIIRNACIAHMAVSLKDPVKRQGFIASGFKGFATMDRFDLVEYVKEHDLAGQNEELQAALDVLG
jgi:hypothetical protein